MKNATVTHAKYHLSSLLAGVEVGEVAVLTRCGRPIARPLPKPETACNWDALEAGFLVLGQVNAERARFVHVTRQEE